MDDDQLDLARQLSTRAGMIMEDASVVAILVARLSPDELRAAIARGPNDDCAGHHAAGRGVYAHGEAPTPIG